MLMQHQTFIENEIANISWIDDIPTHWNLMKMKYVTRVNTNSLPENTDKKFAFEYIDIGNVSYEEGVLKTEKFTFETAPSRARRKLCSGDVIISTVRTYLKAIAQIDDSLEQCIASTGFAVISPTSSIRSDYLAYIAKSEPFLRQVACYSKGVSYPAINSTDIGSILIPLPPLNEQKNIEVALNKKTTEIDAAIKKKIQLIELLKEQKSILVNQVVTKGLDPNASMKDSGIEWIGKVPSHWKLEKVKNIFCLVTEPAAKNNNYELLSVYTDIGVKPRNELEERGNKASTTDGYWHVKKGDIIVNKLLAWMGAIGLSDYDGVTSPAYDILRSKIDIDGNYFHNMFRMKSCSQELKKHSYGIMEMRLRLYFDKFGQIIVPYPPPDEQRAISLRLTKIEDEIGTVINATEREIEKLKEFKQTLIANAVTGKIKV